MRNIPNDTNKLNPNSGNDSAEIDPNGEALFAAFCVKSKVAQSSNELVDGHSRGTGLGTIYRALREIAGRIGEECNMSSAAEVSSEAGPDLQDKMRTTLLAQLRITLVELRLVVTEVEFIGCALRNRLVTPHQAMMMVYERGFMDWLFRDREGAA